MKKKFAIIISILLTFLILIPTTGFSLWYFGENSKTPETNNKSITKVDDIEENYNFSTDHSQDKTYTIYLFPSSIYLKQYKDYLDKKTSVLPEYLFSLSSNEADSLVCTYDETNSSTSMSYSTSSIDVGRSGNNYINYIGNNYSSSNYSHLSSDSVTITNADNVGYVKENYNYSREQFSSKHGTYTYTYGSSYTDAYSDLTDSRVTTDGRSSRFNNKYIFEDDRFGYWSGRDALSGNNTGRYSPVKITVDNSFNQYFYSLLPTPSTSMGDGYGNTLNGTFSDEWYNLTFSSWTYLTPSENEIFFDRYDLENRTSNADNLDFSKTTLKKQANYLLDGFKSLDVMQLFDLTRDLSEYADENGIIRLFPIFSNGKTYDITSDGIAVIHNFTQLNNDLSSFQDPSLAHGGLASAYIVDGDNKRRYLLYNGNANYAISKFYGAAYSSYNREAVSWIYVSQLKNYYYSNSSVSMYVASNKRDSNQNSNFLGAYNSENTNSTVNNYLNSFMSNGGEGLYNVYLFYTNQYISSLSSLTTPHTNYKYAYNVSYFNSLGHYDSYVFNSDAVGLHTMADGYCGAVGRKEYNFAKSFWSTYEEFVDGYDATSYMNYLLQTPSETYSYYKTNFSSLEYNDLNFMSAGKYDSTGTYYGDFVTEKIQSDNDQRGKRAADGTWQINSQFVVAIEKIKETKVVNTDNFSSSEWKSYSSLLSTASSCYYKALNDSTSDSSLALNNSNKLDSEKIYIAEGIEFNQNDPLYLYNGSKESNKIDITKYDSNSYENLYMNFYNKNVSSASDISSTGIYSKLSTYFDTSSMRAKESGIYNFVFYFNDEQEIEVYAYQHRPNFLRVYINEEYQTHSRSKTSDEFVDSYSNWGLLWEYNFNLGLDGTSIINLTENTSGTKYSTSLSGNEFNVVGGESSSNGHETFKEALKRYLTNNNSRNGGNKSIIKIYDNSTDYLVATYYYSSDTLTFTNGSGSFLLKKNHIFYLIFE